MTTKMPAHRLEGRMGTVWRWATKTRGGLWLIVGLGVLAVVVIVVLGMLDREQATTATTDQQQTQVTLDKLADPLASLCQEDASVRARLGDDVCFTAQQVVDMPPPSPIPGPSGDPGSDGRGIVATVIRADGHLVVSYTDGARIDVGAVVGPAGVAGRGIVGSEIADGRLVLRFSDDTTQDLGPVVGGRGADGANGANGSSGANGADGRGIASTAIVNGRLIVTYTDSTTEDAGAVPPGPMGPQGEAAHLPSSYTRNFPDGTSESCSRSGGTDDSPVFDCTDRNAGKGGLLGGG